MTENTMNQTMKAVRIHAYGGPDVMAYEDAPVPTPGEGQVLVRVAAAAFNPADAKVRAGAFKAFMPVTFPHTLGFDLAGTVESIGPGVTTFAPGQAVYGQGEGTFAEYALASAATIAPPPQSLSPLEAASVPSAAITAWQGLFDQAGLEAGQTVLIHGAAGGVGTFAVQLARWKGARVIGTASGQSVAFVQGLGADEVIDYKTTRFEEVVKNVDVVFDLIGGDTQARSLGVLKPGGILVSVVHPPSQDEAKAHGVRAVFFGMRASSALLKQIAALLDAGTIKTIVTQTFALSEVAQLQGHDQHARGKTVFEVAPPIAQKQSEK